MKKAFIVVIILLVTLGIYNVSINLNFINKVVYELIDDYKQMSLDSLGESTLTDEVVVRVKLDYEEFNTITNTDIAKQEKYRSEAKEYYSNNNEKYLSNINLYNFKSVYVSKYTPYIEFTYQRDKYFNFKQNISNEINKNASIDVAYIKDVTINKTGQLRHAMYVSGVSDNCVTNSNTRTGYGIKVGVLEPGLVDEDAACFSIGQVTTHIQNTPLESVQEHSTYMAGYIAGSDGIASDAKIYSSYLWGSPSEEIDWLLDNGVHIINMSYGDANPTGEYASDSAYIDMIVNNYKITMVGAVGNVGASSALVSNPALAYNVIGVGSGNNGGYPEQYSSYIEYSGGPKPTLMALGTGLCMASLGGGNSGTSVACAVVSGIIALLMEEYPILKERPELVISTLVASAYQPEEAILMPNGLTNSGGAGLIRYDQFHHAYIDNSYISTNIGVLQTFIFSKTMFLSQNEMHKFCIAWTAYTNGSTSSLNLTNYDLYLYDSNGNVVASSCSTNSNIELIQYYVPTDGEYTLKIKEVTFVAKINEKVAFSYGLMPEEITYD